MKKFIVAFLALMLITATAIADVVTVDLASATDDELSSFIQTIRDEQTNRYKEKLAAQQIDADPDGITFRGIPWFSTVEATEKAIGQVSEYKYASDLRRLGYIDYSNVTTGADRVDGDLGCNVSYAGLSVAGYQPSSSIACYIFPIVDGQIVRDIQSAQIYMGYYTFESEDYGDLSIVYDDLARKLEQLYGKGNESSTEYYTNTVWQDDTGNVIRLRKDNDASYLTLAYVASTADSRLDDMAVAYVDEKTREEDAIRNENVNNTDGL